MEVEETEEGVGQEELVEEGGVEVESVKRGPTRVSYQFIGNQGRYMHYYGSKGVGKSSLHDATSLLTGINTSILRS